MSTLSPSPWGVILVVSLADVMAVNGFGDVCKLRTQDPENFDEEVKSLLSA